MGKIAALGRKMKAQAAAAPGPGDLPPPASEGEVPDAAPMAPPIQTSSTPKMVAPASAPKVAKVKTASTRTMRKPIGKGY